ncbi:hypothetical protein [Lactococcus lactis]|uniref:hypothetical protein n=1 Tax=Lactococcus lactis TaxID=1358 RepID=UPI00071CE71A|nr:hypothetical protein [Lactococcus lactis]KST86787.1 hypothetical protein LK337_0086 [Lactococcus lactis subsp. lactis]
MNTKNNSDTTEKLGQILEGIFDCSVTNVKDATDLLQKNGFKKGEVIVPSSGKRSKIGIYIFEANTVLDADFDDYWRLRQESNKVPKLNTDEKRSKEILYVGKSTSKGVISRINQHYKKITQDVSTYALKLEDKKLCKYKIKCHYYEFKQDDKKYCNAIVAIFEQLLHDKLQPRVGSSR